MDTIEEFFVIDEVHLCSCHERDYMSRLHGEVDPSSFFRCGQCYNRRSSTEEAPMEIADFQQILVAARQLPKPSQVQLVSALLQEQESGPQLSLEPLTGMTAAELKTLADAMFAPAQA